MNVPVNDAQSKELIKEAVIELMREKHDLLLGIIVEAMEEIGLANAIREGRRNEFVSEERITAILEGQDKARA